MLWSYAVHLTYKGDVPVWLLQPVVFCIINWKFCFCFRHFNLNSPWALETGLTRQIFSRAVLISFHCILLVQLLLFLISCYFCSLKFFSLTFLVSIIWYLKKKIPKPHNSQTCLMPPCTVWLLIFVCRALTSKAVQRETLPEAVRSRGSLGSRGWSSLPAHLPCKWLLENDFVPFWLCVPGSRIFSWKSLGTCTDCFFFFSLHSEFVHH